MTVKIDLRRMRLSSEEKMQEDLLEAKTPYNKLLIAARYGNVALANTLLEQGASVNVDPDAFVTTPLYAASCAGQLDMVKFLISKGADVNQPSNMNLRNNPLNISISQRHFDVFDYLLSQGANVNIKGWDNTTALHAAAGLAEYNMELSEKFIRKLLEKGADINVHESTLGKPLEKAIFLIRHNVLINDEEKLKRIEKIKKLLSNNISPEKKESKEKEVKEKEIKGINAAQLSLLKSFIGAGLTKEENNEKGFLIEAIESSKTVDLGTKILYLRRAISQPCHSFLISLDKLYKTYPDDKEKNNDNIDFIRTLKKINDMCIRPCLTQDFGRLRAKDVTTKDEAAAFKKYVKMMIHDNIKLLKKGHQKKIHKQIITRKKAEKTIVGNLAWRTLLELPHDQRTLRATQPLNHLGAIASTHSMGVIRRTPRFAFRDSMSGSRRGTFFSIHDRGGYRTLGEEQRVEDISNLLSPHEEKNATSNHINLNTFQSDALSRLRAHGLNETHFVGTGHWFNTFQHVFALSNLMRSRGSENMTADVAMAVIEALSDDQLLNIESWQPSPSVASSLRR